MKALWQIILAILWRLRPVQALEVNLRDIIEMGLAMFADDLGVEDLAADPAYRATIAAALADAHRKLDLLIYLRACELTGKRINPNGFQPNYAHTHGSAGLNALWRTFHRLIARFDDYERLAAKRAEGLKREQDDYPLRLAAALQSAFPSLGPLQVNRRRLAGLIANGGIDGSARQSAIPAEGRCASARGPPPLHFPKSAPPTLEASFRDRAPMPNPSLQNRVQS